MAAPWFRFYSETLNDRKIDYICRATGRSKALIIGAWATILALANDSPIRGALLLAEDIPLTVGDLAMHTGLEPEEVQTLIDNFRRLKMLEMVNSTFYVSNWDKRQFANDISTERVQRWRARQKDEGEASENSEGDETPDPDGETDETLQKLPQEVTVTHQIQITDSETETERESHAHARENLSPTDPNNPENAAWIAELENAMPPPHSPPHSEEELRQGVQAATLRYFARQSGELWRAWGTESGEVKPRPGVSVDAIQQVGYLLEHEFGVRPMWSNRKRVKDWVSGLAELYETASGDLDAVRQAGHELRAAKDGNGKPFRISRPQSLFNTLSGIMAEKRRPVKPSQLPPGTPRFRKVAVGT